MLRPGEIFVDLFAGGGGASTGIEMAIGRSVDIAVNHDPQAIAMHMANHPNTKHYCESVWKVDPRAVCGGRPVGGLWASPDCKHFSKAKGGKPVEKKIRGLAWVVLKWAGLVPPRVIWLENVEEFRTWGPLVDGRPCPARKGMTFKRWVTQLRNLGYAVEWRELRACDYGTPTIRKRLFVIARRDGLPIVWPKPTHGPRGELLLPPWRSAAECIDWSIPCQSIFGRARPLKDNTLRRIARGVMRYVIEAAEPFIVPVTHTAGGNSSRPTDEPLATITTAKGGELALVVPHITKFHGNATGHAIDDPMATVTAGGDMKRDAGAAHALGLVSAFMVPRYGEREGQEPRAMPVGNPMPTVVPTANGAQIVAAFLAQHNSERGDHVKAGRDVRQPISTIVQSGSHQSVVTSHLVKLKGTAPDGQPVTEPLHTVQAGGQHYGEVRAFLIKYYGEGGQWQSLREPVHTVPTRDRLGLVTVQGVDYAIVDIGMRMLTPRELFRAQGFADSYIIDPEVGGKRLNKTAQVRMCGNSVCPPIAAALVRANLAGDALPEARAA